MEETFEEYIIRNMSAEDLVDVLELDTKELLDKVGDIIDWDRLKQFVGWIDE